MSTTTDRPTLWLNIVLYKEGEYWVAECLELGLVSSGVDKDIVLENSKRSCVGQILWAWRNDPDLTGLFHPPNPKLMKRVALGRDCGLTVIFTPTEANVPVVMAHCVAA